MKKLISLFFFLSFLTAAKAHALFDVRLSYGLLASNPDLSELYNGGITVPSVAPTYGIGVDGVVKLPLIPVGFGLRYENMGLTASNSGLDFKADYSRTSLLVNYHFIDTLLYVGPLLTYGISHSGKIKATENGVDKSNFSPGSVTSYSIGVEAGIKLLAFTVGAEVGYEDFRWNNSRDSTGNLPNRDINMSGSYGKIVLGFGI